MSGLPHSGSLNDKLSKLEVGDRAYFETDLSRYSTLQRSVSAKSRYPEAMRGMEFSTQLFTAVSAARAGDIRYLVCVERVK